METTRESQVRVLNGGPFLISGEAASIRTPMKPNPDNFCLVEFPIFSDYIIHVEAGKDIPDLVRKYKIRGVNLDERADGLTVKRDQMNMTMVFFKGRPDLGTIAHEAFHAVTQMFDWCGVKYDEETVAYHLGYTVNCICSFFRKGRAPRNGRVRMQ
jgi:hypothetical protein